MSNLHFKYDIIVVGAGHAGCEAAMAAATLGSKVLLITMDMEKIAQMSCNPAIGGIAKGQIVREIDALGGYTGIIADRSTIQFRMLNRSKGPAMWSPRSQCDRMYFSKLWRSYLEKNENIDFWQGTVRSLIFEEDKVVGVKTDLGVPFHGESVILTAGTFLNGLMHVGQEKMKGGRISEPDSPLLSDQLAKYDFEVGRMKTGTPVRIDARSVNFSKLTEQEGDKDVFHFSYAPDISSDLKQLSCYIAYTNVEVHNMLKTGFDDSPLFDGTIQSTGPRYCPSIETKLQTFADKDQHHLFLEPEGHDTVECYLNGFSSSLPWDVQYEALRKVEGFEDVKIFRPGYAIEYDYFSPTQLHHTLETKKISNLFFAGQINGTTGYEEAAAQGLIAGVNAHCKRVGDDQFILGRDEGYIGVLIDDLVTKGVDEPYRMFTSRAEYRILLRQDNADQRLSPRAISIGLLKNERAEHYHIKQKNIDDIEKFVRNFSVKPAMLNDFLSSKNSSLLKQGVKLSDVISRPNISLLEIVPLIDDLNEKYLSYNKYAEELFSIAEIRIKYQGYIDREKEQAEKMKRLEEISLSDDFNYHGLQSLSTEARMKLSSIKPKTIGQASRIPGVSPSDINVLLVVLGR